MWRETVTHHDNFDHNTSDKKLSDHPTGSQNHHHSDKTCKNHPEDDILWRETVSHQNFITTSPHSFIPDDNEATTVTPLSDLSRFLVPPVVHETDAGRNHHLDHTGMIQSALSQVREDVTLGAQARKQPLPSNKKGVKKLTILLCRLLRAAKQNIFNYTHGAKNFDLQTINHCTGIYQARPNV